MYKADSLSPLCLFKFLPEVRTRIRLQCVCVLKQTEKLCKGQDVSTVYHMQRQNMENFYGSEPE